MTLVLSTTLLLLGATAFLGSVLVVTTASPDERFPAWSNPTTRRGASIGLRLLGVVLVMLPITWGLGASVGPRAGLPLAAAFAPAVTAVVAHNRAVGRRERIRGAACLGGALAREEGGMDSN